MALRIEANSEPIPGYRLLERLGGGGFGEVWRVEAPGGLHKAIKIVHGDLTGTNDTQRAEQELKALKRVQSVRHPYVLSLERYDVVEGRLLIVMELADRNLWDRFKECRAQSLPGIPRDEILRYLEETAEALDLMNQEFQLQHLDIKPQNLFLVHNHVKVADFGLVKDMEGSQASITGGITPVYAAPETFDGTVTRYSDQYSLAIVYQELLTGQRPFNGTTVRQLILQHLQGIPDVSPLPPADQPIIARALGKVPNERFPTCLDLIRSLRDARVRGGEIRETIRSPEEEHSILGAVPSTRLPHPPIASPPPLAARPQAAAPAVGGSGSDQGTTHCIRAIDPVVLRPTEPAEQRKAPPEATGPGTLFPGLVIGLGQLGFSVLQGLREHLTTHVGPASQLLNLRLLLLDTDPEIMRATAGSRVRPEGALNAGEVLMAPLNRPGHYLKPRDGRPNLESWLNLRMVYRIPRSQVTTGVRALGRLAFLDNYRNIVRRLQLELETILNPASLQTAGRSTGLGMRTNRPRIYIVTNLAGGTGSGMFLDLAYTLRALLRQMGYEQPDVVGLLLLPAVDTSRTRVMGLGNTYAALTELNHFANPKNTFQARYHEREAPIQDDGPPFSRCVILPLPEETDEVATQELAELAGQFLARDLTSPLGRAADLGRAEVSSPPWASRGLFYQTFGMFNLVCPRRALIEAASRKLSQCLVQRWLCKDARPFRSVLQEWVKQQWQNLALDAQNFIQRLQDEVARLHGQSPEAAFDALLPELPPPPAKGKSTEIPGLDAEQIRTVLDGFQELLGKPQDDSSCDPPGQLVNSLRTVGDKLATEWSQKLAELPVYLIEHPEYRLAGAEEAIRQLVATLEQTLQHHEPLAQEFSQKAQESHEWLRTLAMGGKPGGKRAVAVGEVLELLKSYPRWRYRSLVLQQVARAFVGLRGHLSDELREVNFCRVRLGELLRMLEEGPANIGLDRSRPGCYPGGENRPSGTGRRLFLGGSRDLAEAVEQFMSNLTPEHLTELDEKVQEVIQSRFTALVHVCMTSANILKNVEATLRETAREFAASCLPPLSVADLFFEHYPDAEEANLEIASFYDEAAPELTSRMRSTLKSASRGATVGELCVLAAPEGEGSKQFCEAVQKLLPETDLITASSADDVVIYRERLNLSLAELEQLGSLGHDAYSQMTATDHFTPHTRIDVAFTGPLK